jgi:hypothetical protein
MRHALIALFVFSLSLYATEVLELSPKTANLGKMKQGDTKQLQIKIKNTSTATVVLDLVLSQNIGSSNFKYPESLAAGQSGVLNFDFSSAFLEGAFTHNIIVVANNVNHIAQINGAVENPIQFSNRVIDLGFVGADGKAESEAFYIWPEDQKKEFEIMPASTNNPALKFIVTKVKLDISNPTEIVEGGKTWGYKVLVKADGLKKKSKSIRELIGFVSPQYPKATPEAQLVGYWK